MEKTMNNNQDKKCPHDVYEWVRVDDETMARVCYVCGETIDTKKSKKREYNKKAEE